VHLYGLKGAQADVQSHERSADAALLQALKKFRREVQAGCWSSHRTGLTSEHGLVTLLVSRLCSALANVRRQGHLAAVLQQKSGRTRLARTSEPVPLPSLGNQLQLQRPWLHLNRLTFNQPPARLREEFPEAIGLLAEKQPFPLAT